MMSNHESQRPFRPLLDRVVVQIRAHPKPVRAILQNVHLNGDSSPETRLVQEQRILHGHKTVVRAVDDE